MKFSNKAFTLIELLVAITVMAVSIVAVYALVPRAIKTSKVNADRFIVAQLANEGIEVIKNIRDTNWLEQMTFPANSWDEGLTNCAAGCEVDYLTPSIQDPVLPLYETGRYLKVDINGFYNYSSGQQTNFKRKVIITPTGTGLLVKVEVNWSSDYPASVLEETLYDWK